MKHIKLYESYISEKYITYDKMGNWGNASDIEDDLRMTVINMFLYGGISNQLDDVIYTDQSSDKGIKWEIEVKGKSSDTLHAYKDGKMRGQYEWFLNKKKSSKGEIQDYFLNKYVSELDKYIAAMEDFDVNYEYADGKAYKEGAKQADELRVLYKALSKADQKKAYNAFIKTHKSTDVDFKSFYGV